LEMKMTSCAPPGARAAFVRLTMVNHLESVIRVSLVLKASWGALSRVTYLPVPLRGERSVALAPWVDPGEVFSYITDDTHFAWSLIHPESQGRMTAPPSSLAPGVDAARTVALAPGASTEAVFVLGVGVEEFSAPHSAKALREMLDRSGADKVIEDAATWLQQRARTTGQADVDLLMNRNLFFAAFYAWGKTIDTEQTVGITSRSPRYYVSAAYWDRDAMLWSFPGFLDIDPALAREALEYALGPQLRNTGTHSRFIDGIVLEDGFQLDEAVAPLVAFAAYIKRTNDDGFLRAHRDALIFLRDRCLGRFDPGTGLYSSLQDSQDEYQKKPFLIYDNVLAWKALSDLASLLERLGETQAAKDATSRAEALHDAILKNGVFADPSGSGEKMFAFATDGKQPLFADVPPGSLMKLPALGFVPENDPIFQHTYQWLHSPSYKYSYSDRAYGLPGSYRLPFTTSWEVADHLQLNRGHHLALKILRASNWDGGIITEGVDPATGVMDHDGRAFATAAGYVAHAICAVACIDGK